MKKLWVLGFASSVLPLICLFTPSFAFAHPGSVSSDGCHFCRTNCEKWGWTYNTRHGHSGQPCDPSKGPIDPLYGGVSITLPQPQDTPNPVSSPVIIYSPKPSPVFVPTPTPSPSPSPYLSPTPSTTIEPSVFETVSPSLAPTPSPEVKGVATNDSKKFNFRWWIITPLTKFLAIIFGWK